MQYRGDVVVEIAFLEAPEKFVLIEVVGDVAIDEVAEFVPMRQIVDGENALLASGVEPLHEIRADESRSTSDDRVHVDSYYG